MKTKKNYENYLNEIGNGLSEENFIIGGKMRRCSYGTATRRYDPIGFELGYHEWKNGY